MRPAAALLIIALGTAAAAAPLVGAATREQNAGEGRSIILQSTTSTQNSGLYAYLLPLFEAETGIRVNVVAVGTGQALRNAGNCDGDILIAHAREAEEAFVAEGKGDRRSDLMFNDFVLVGPASDPAGVAGAGTAAEALRRVAASGAVFASRGDDSGTYRKERALWEASGTDPDPASGRWYRETGSGMGATLNIAVGMDAYALTDRATWSSHGNKGAHRIVLEGDPALFNQYGVIPVSTARCPNVDGEAAAMLEAWLLSPAGQEAIGAFAPDGEALFTPNAKATN